MLEVLNTCTSYEASINYMRQMGELQGKCDNQISARHWLEDTDGTLLLEAALARMFRNKKLKKKKKTDRQPQTNRSTKPKEFAPVQYAHKNLQNSINVQDQVADEFEKMFFYSMDLWKKCSRTEAFASLDIILPNRKGDHKLKIKMDTGAEENTLPLRTFQQMFSEYVDWNGQRRPGTTQKEVVVLTAYNGSSIPQHGSIQIQCAYKGEWGCVKFFIVTSNGPTILGLPSLQDWRLVTLHCSIQRTKCVPVNHEINTPVTPSDNTPINSTKDLIEAYPDQFDRIGNFAGKYHIVLRPNNHPIVHAHRKCPIHMRDEVKAELDEMISQRIIQKVDEPTDWISSIVYVRKSNGKLHLCLDPKDLNKAIMRCHYKTPTMEELSHKLSGAKFFSKLGAKNGYWSVKLDRESQLLTTFNSPFGRYCFQRMPFDKVMSQDVFQQRIDMIIGECTGALALIDDVIVHGKTKEEHDLNLRKLMDTARTTGLTFNSNKCAIVQERQILRCYIRQERDIPRSPKSGGNKITPLSN